MSHAKTIIGLGFLGASIYGLMRYGGIGQASASDTVQTSKTTPSSTGGFLASAESDLLMTGKQWTTPTKGQIYEAWFLDASSQYGLPAGLLSRQCYQESRYNPKAYNAGSKAAGLMQFIPATAKEFGIDPYDAKASIYAGAKYMAQLYKRFGNWKDALAAYNWGQGNLSRKGIAAAPLETRNYFAQILTDIGLA